MNVVAAKQQVDLFEIGTEMRKASLPDTFVAEAIHTLGLDAPSTDEGAGLSVA